MSDKTMVRLSVREQTYRLLKEKILNGHFPAGQSDWLKNRLPDCLASAALRSVRRFTSWSLKVLSGKRERGGSVFLKKRPRKCLNSLKFGRYLKDMHCPVSAGRYQRTMSGVLSECITRAEHGVLENKLDLVFEYNTKFHDMLYQSGQEREASSFSFDRRHA